MPSDLNGKCEKDLKNYLFKMIETLLPKGIEDSNVNNGTLKMMELWGSPDHARKGWVRVCEK